MLESFLGVISLQGISLFPWSEKKIEIFSTSYELIFTLFEVPAASVY